MLEMIFWFAAVGDGGDILFIMYSEMPPVVRVLVPEAARRVYPARLSKVFQHCRAMRRECGGECFASGDERCVVLLAVCFVFPPSLVVSGCSFKMSIGCDGGGCPNAGGRWCPGHW